MVFLKSVKLRVVMEGLARQRVPLWHCYHANTTLRM